MDSNRKTAKIAGILFIVATTFFMIGQSIYDPIINAPDYLENTHPNKLNILIGILIEIIGVFAIILIPAFLFPVLKKHDEALAFGYAGFRFLEAGFLIIVIVGVLSQINISQNFIDSGVTDSSHFEILWNGVQAINEWAFMMSVSLLFPLGALIVYILLYRTKLVPRFISIWGFFAAALLLIGSVLIMFDVFAGVSEMILELIFSLPIAVQEMVMAIWLIVKGFNYKAQNSR